MPKNSITTDNTQNLVNRIKFDLNCKDNLGYSIITDDEDVMIITENGTIIRISTFENGQLRDVEEGYKVSYDGTIYKGKEIRWFFTDYKDERELRNMIGVLLSE